MKVSEVFKLPVSVYSNHIRDKNGDRLAEFDYAVEDDAAAHAINCHDELVGALIELKSIIDIHSKSTGNNFAWAELELVDEVLKKVRS